jgi:thiol-disulfide isomerase/thioredoxin
MELKGKSTLDTVANIAIILVCAIAAFILIRNHFFNPNQAGGPGQRPPEIEAGEKYEALGKMVPAGAERALVVALSPTCHFCEESMPFYKRLVDERNQKASNVKVIAAVPREEVKAEEQQKLTAAGVNADGLVVLDFDSVKLRGTPTILLVDNKGEVHDVWVGKQPASGEEEILEAL